MSDKRDKKRARELKKFYEALEDEKDKIVIRVWPDKDKHKKDKGVDEL